MHRERRLGGRVLTVEAPGDEERMPAEDALAELLGGPALLDSKPLTRRGIAGRCVLGLLAAAAFVAICYFVATGVVIAFWTIAASGLR